MLEEVRSYELPEVLIIRIVGINGASLERDMPPFQGSGGNAIAAAVETGKLDHSTAAPADNRVDKDNIPVNQRAQRWAD